MAALEAVGQKIAEAEATVEQLQQQEQELQLGGDLVLRQLKQQELVEARRQLTALLQKEVLLLKQQQAAPTQYANITVHIVGSEQKPDEYVQKFDQVTRKTLQKLLDDKGCVAVRLPGTNQVVDLDSIDLHDNMLLTALPHSVPWEARVSTLEGFLESTVKSFEADATEAMLQHLEQQHSSAKVVPIRRISSADGRIREVDGAVVADQCAAILEAKQVLDDSAVQQLASSLEFIRSSQPVGEAAQLQKPKLLGFLAGRTLTSPARVQRLVDDCRERGYGILVSSGQSLSLGNSRVPRLRVDCGIGMRVRAPSSAVRVLV